MKVGLISFHTFLQPGGVKNHILGLYNEFKKRGIETKIIVPRRKKEEDYGKDVILLGTSFPLKFSGSQSDLNINFNPFSIAKVLEKEKFDILHFHNFGLPSAFQILGKSKALNILTFHADIEGSKFLKNFPIIVNLIQKIVQWKIDGVIGVAALNLKIFRNYRGPKIVIPNGIDLKEFKAEFPKVKRFADDKINILFVGRIEERKGLIYLLKAYKILARKFPNLRLLVIGEGELKRKYQDWVKKNRLKEVFFLGRKQEGELPQYYRSADIFVSPAIFGESFGIVLLEAMAAAKPIVVFANQGYKEFLQGKQGAFMIKPRDWQALARKIEILIENKNLRDRMGQWGQTEAQNYSWQKIAEKVLEFYEACRRKKQKKSRVSSLIDGFFSLLYDNDIRDWLGKPK